MDKIPLEFALVILALFVAVLPLLFVRIIIELVIFFSPEERLTRFVGWSIGPNVPIGCATRRDVVRVASIWIGIASAAVAGTSWWLAGWAERTASPYLVLHVGPYVIMSLALYAGSICFLESAWALVRLFRARPSDDSGKTACRGSASARLAKPPNYRMNPPTGGGHSQA